MSAARATRNRKALRLEVRPASRAWTPARSRMNRWAAAALGRLGEGREIAVRVVGPGESRALNRRWRGKDEPTNVLSFPAPAAPAAMKRHRGMRRETYLPLGDLVICADVVKREAARDGKPVEAHWAHMVVHGALHLAGYDHEAGRRERLRMERREIAVLRGFGIGNPYT
jgi:probable rRNA maturation factor